MLHPKFCVQLTEWIQKTMLSSSDNNVEYELEHTMHDIKKTYVHIKKSNNNKGLYINIDPKVHKAHQTSSPTILSLKRHYENSDAE